MEEVEETEGEVEEEQTQGRGGGIGRDVDREGEKTYQWKAVGCVP